MKVCVVKSNPCAGLFKGWSSQQHEQLKVTTGSATLGDSNLLDMEPHVLNPDSMEEGCLLLN